MPPKSLKDVTLPLFPLAEGAVLLPGNFLRLNANAVHSPSLVQHLLRTSSKSPANSSSKRLGDVVAVPIIFTGATSTAPADDNDTAALDFDTLHSVGCVARVIELTRQSNHDWTLVLEGRCRVSIREVSLASGGIFTTTIRQLDYFGNSSSNGSSRAAEPSKEELELQRKVLHGVKEMFAAAQSARPEVTARTVQVLQNYGPALTADVVGALIARTTEHRLELLSTVDVAERLRLVDALLQRQLAAVARLLPLTSSSRAQRGATSTARAATTVSSESDGNTPTTAPDRNSPEALLARMQAKNPPAEALEAAHREIRRLKLTGEQHPGHAASMTYLETLADLPWSLFSTATAAATAAAAGEHSAGKTLSDVRAQLDRDHFGMNKVKERIVQYVAVQILRGWTARAPVLCLVGPPGVGKTSLAKSIAAALHRPFQRISLGGVRDEAEIRGHRRTYVGALPGRIVTALRKAGASDAVLLLDEIDKTGKDARGDPASALLEVLDPEQNAAFHDTYLGGVPVDLSRVIFIATANSASDIPPPLMDRMEMVFLSSYTLDEKVEIGARHLVPKTLEEHGISADRVEISKDALVEIIDGYTREAGVRQLGRCLAAVCRYVAVEMVNAGEVGAAVGGLGGFRNGNGDSNSSNGDVSNEIAEDQSVPSSEASAVAGIDTTFPTAFANGSSCASSACGSYQLQQLEDLRRHVDVDASFDQSYVHQYRGQHLQQQPPSPSSESASPSAQGWFAWLPWHKNADQQRSAAEFKASARIFTDQSDQVGWQNAWQVHGGHSTRTGGGGGGGGGNCNTARQQDVGASSSMRLLGPGSMGLLASFSPSSISTTTQESSNNDTPSTNLPLTTTTPSSTSLAVGPSSLVPSLPTITIDTALIEHVLGPRKFRGHDPAERVASPGAAAGLVWTQHGGQVQYIECLCVGNTTTNTSQRSGSGNRQQGTLTLTGQLGDVLEESARIAVSWARAHSKELGLPGGNASLASQMDVHIHLPAGAVRKDGPSAGITLAVALVSLFTGKCVRGDTAFTGELTLRGLVLPVGGVKEKIIAAAAAGMRRVVLPAQNVIEVRAELAAGVLEQVELVPVEKLEQALEAAFDPPLKLLKTNKEGGEKEIGGSGRGVDGNVPYSRL